MSEDIWESGSHSTLLNERKKRNEMKSDKDVLVIKINANLNQRSLTRIRECIMRQKESGLVILPDFCEVIVVPKDIEIQLEGKDDGRVV